MYTFVCSLTYRPIDKVSHALSIAGKGNQLSILNSSQENNFLLQSFTRLFIK